MDARLAERAIKEWALGNTGKTELYNRTKKAEESPITGLLSPHRRKLWARAFESALMTRRDALKSWLATAAAVATIQREGV